MLPPLERLSELVERVVVLLDQAPTPPESAPEPEPEPEPQQAAEEPQAAPHGHVLFVADAAGYRLLAREGEAPARGQILELEDGPRRVVRVGPSPLPGDRRRCAFLEQEPRRETRTPHG